VCPNSLVGEHALQSRLIGRVDDHALMQFLFALVRLGSQDMAAEGVVANDLPIPRFLEPLGRTFMGLELGHKNSLDRIEQERSLSIAPVCAAPKPWVTLERRNTMSRRISFYLIVSSLPAFAQFVPNRYTV